MDKFFDIANIFAITVSIISVGLVFITVVNTLHLEARRTRKSKFNCNLQAKPGFDNLIQIFDFLMALISLISLSLIMGIVAIVIKAYTGETIFVKEEILGKGNRPIYVYKFRTRKTSGEGKMFRRFGDFLIKTAIRELPLIISVIKGDIALFGLAQIKYNKLGEIEKHTPNIREAYNYYKPGVASLHAIRWNVVNEFDNASDYYGHMHDTNLEFLCNRSFSYVLGMMCRTVYLVFKPFDQDYLHDS